MPVDPGILQKRVVKNSGEVVPFNPEILRKGNPEIKVLLSWEGDADLDIAAFMLDRNGSLRGNAENLIFYNTERRWKPELDFEDENYTPLRGKVSLWPASGTEFRNNDEWFFVTLPLSLDDSLIGARDNRGDDDDENEEITHEEELYVRLSKIDIRRYRSIAIVASIHQEDNEPPKKFSDIFNPLVNIYDAGVNQKDIEYQLNNANFANCECVIVGFIKYNEVTSRWDYVTADKGYNNFLDAINSCWE